MESGGSGSTDKGPDVSPDPESGGRPGFAGNAFGATFPDHQDTALGDIRTGFYDMNTMDEQTLGSLIGAGRFGGVIPGTNIGFAPEMSLNVKGEMLGRNALMGLVTGGVNPLGSTGNKGFAGLASLAASGLRNAGVTAAASGFKGGPGETGREPNPVSAPSDPQALVAQLPQGWKEILALIEKYRLRQAQGRLSSMGSVAA